jgi:acetolactate synthase-1/2/3 large subunit
VQTRNTKKLLKPSISDATARSIIQTLLEAKNPLIYAGGGVILADAADELKTFVDHLNIPVAHSLMGKGVLPDDHDFTLGMTGFWGTQFVNDQCLKADWVFGLGTRFAEADCSSWEPEFTFNFASTRLIHIDIDPAEIGRNYPVEIGAVADLKQALIVLNRVAREMLPAGRSNAALRDSIAAYRKEFKAGNQQFIDNDCFPMMPERILSVVRDALPRDAFITTDVGWNKNGVGQQFPIYVPGSILTPGGYATMGFGAPAALGAKVAFPERVVISLVGDGGFGQNPALLATAVEENIPVIWVVMNNCAFGTIAGLQKAHFGTTVGTLFRIDGEPYSADFAAIARAYGAEGVKIQSAAEFKEVLERAIKSNKPFVIDVAMRNNPVLTSGHWNILDIYSPNARVSHVSTD